MNVFLKDKEHYKRNIDPIKHYVEQVAFYLHKRTGDPLDKCLNFVNDEIRNGAKPLKNPKIVYFERDQETLDRHKKTTTLFGYITSTIKRGDILAPTFTTYIHPTSKVSKISGFVNVNTKKRSVFKKDASKAKANTNEDLFSIMNNRQATMKTYNNSLSGSFATDSSVLHNTSAHSTLTSITRTVSSFGNVYNERMISGNRHYRDYNIVINNIISIAYKTNHKEIRDTIAKYNLVYPTVEEAFSCVLHSTKLNFTDKVKEEKIFQLLLTLNKEELADFVYGGDLFQIRKLNENFMRTFLSKLSRKVEDVIYDDPFEAITKFDESVVNLVHHICADTIRLVTMYGYKDKIDLKTMHIVASTAKNVHETLLEYKDFINAFLLSNNIPPSHAYVKEMPRRVVVLSDTDSTCSTYQEWVEWYYGTCLFTEKELGVSASVMLLSTSVVAHALALFSGNLNVEKDKLHSLAMKNEYAWLVMTPLNVRKHYYADTLIKEGLVFKETELEKKGVHLINSNMPPSIKKKTEELMKFINHTVSSGNKIKLMNVITDLISLEQSIIHSVLTGKDEYFRKINIQNGEAYKNGEEDSPYMHYKFWDEALSKFYGKVEPPPFRVIKIPTTLTTPNKYKEWLETILDNNIKESISSWMVKYKKDKITTLYIPLEFVERGGVPDIFKNIIDIKRMILDICNSLYLILESLGYYKKEGLILSDYFEVNQE